MKVIRVIKNWDYPDFFRQTPKNRGIWKEFMFTLKPVKSCDYVIVLNYSSKKEKVYCSAENIWCIQQEPHNEYFAVRHKYAAKIYKQIFTTDNSLKDRRFIHSHGCLPWHINKSYDWLKKSIISKKIKQMSCIISSKSNFAGHRSRLSFVKEVYKKLSFDLYGYGIKPIKDKWDGLAPYKYSLVLENFSGAYYWSEKIADCFLSWTMPVYYGCTNISKYFPKESYVSIDIKNPDAIDIIKETVSRNLFKKNIEAIAYARKLILEKYQFFPFVADKIYKWEKEGHLSRKQGVIIPNENTFFNNLKLNIRRLPYYLSEKVLR